MGMFTSINIAATGMAAERLRSDVISDNIANASTTRTQDGGVFRKSTVVFRPVEDSNPTWNTPFVPSSLENSNGSLMSSAMIQSSVSTPIISMIAARAA